MLDIQTIKKNFDKDNKFSKTNTTYLEKGLFSGFFNFYFNIINFAST